MPKKVAAVRCFKRRQGAFRRRRSVRLIFAETPATLESDPGARGAIPTTGSRFRNESLRTSPQNRACEWWKRCVTMTTLASSPVHQLDWQLGRREPVRARICPARTPETSAVTAPAVDDSFNKCINHLKHEIVRPDPTNPPIPLLFVRARD